MHFMVRMEGRGISVPFVDGEDPAIGFHTSRKVWARDVREAGAKAQALLLAQWQREAYAASGVPTLTIVDAWPLGWWRGLLTRRRIGYVFYRYDD